MKPRRSSFGYRRRSSGKSRTSKTGSELQMERFLDNRRAAAVNSNSNRQNERGVAEVHGNQECSRPPSQTAVNRQSDAFNQSTSSYQSITPDQPTTTDQPTTPDQQCPTMQLHSGGEVRVALAPSLMSNRGGSELMDEQDECLEEPNLELKPVPRSMSYDK